MAGTDVSGGIYAKLMYSAEFVRHTDNPCFLTVGNPCDIQGPHMAVNDVLFPLANMEISYGVLSGGFGVGIAVEPVSRVFVVPVVETEVM